MQPFQDWEFSKTALATVNNSTGPAMANMVPLRVKRMKHYSNRPKSQFYTALNDQTFDPYAHYVDNIPHQRYLDNLKARGYNAAKAARPDYGHPWELIDYEHTASPISIRLSNANGWWTYGNVYYRTTGNPNWGPFVGYGGPAVDFINLNPPSGLDNFAQRGIVATAPNPQQFDLAQFIGELREGLPKLGIATFQARAAKAKSAGSDYLNVEFGWKPLLRDLRSAFDVLTKSSSLLNGLPIPGQPMRRAWGVPESYVSEDRTGLSVGTIAGPAAMSTDVGTVWNRAFPGQSGSASGFSVTADVRASKTRTVERWFVGSYTYFLPMGFDATSYLDRVRLLSNVEMTPDVLWELTPWSWLIDWAFQLGKSLEANQLAVNELLHIHYAYAMEKVTDKYYLDVSRPVVSGFPGASLPRYSAAVTTRTQKRRLRANPFGFTSGGLSGLTTKQIAILAALGLTKT